VVVVAHAAATRELVALTYDDVAGEADAVAATQPVAADAATRRAAWARTRAEQHRRAARQLWAVADSMRGSLS
jgi:hypothetical protein